MPDDAQVSISACMFDEGASRVNGPSLRLLFHRIRGHGAAADFIDSILAGRQPAQDIHTAKHILQVPLAIYEASRVGRAVSPDSMK